MTKRTLFLILIPIIILSFSSEGQVSYGGSPASFNHFKSAVLELPVVEMVPVNNFDLQLKEVQSKSQYKKETFAKAFDVDISPDNSGIWDVSNGMRIWRVVIRSKGAYSLSILFERAILPTGASIFIYSPDHQILRGAFNANNEQTSGMLPIFPLPGDEIIVEYNEPESVAVRGELHISKVNHGYKNAIGTRPLGEAGLCNMDVYCQGAAIISKEKQAVIQLVIAGTDLCTGTLVNNTKRDKTPYLLTAGHCITSASDAQRTVFSFNYESPYCGKNGSMNGYADQSMTGSILRARSDSLDFALVELEMLPPPSYRPYYAGWDRNKTIPASTRTVHHPKGDVKKVTIDNDPPIGSTTYSQQGKAQNVFFLIKKWDLGTTEAGSSGGPLFSNENLVIGTLTGGFASCESNMDDYFAMFANQWSYTNMVTRQLKKWLDPGSTGETKIEAMDPYTSPSVCNQFSDVLPDEKYELVKMTNGRGYISGHNSMRTLSYAQEFNTTQKTTLSAFSVGVAKAISGVSNSNSLVVFQIYSTNENTGVPGALLKSVQLPIKSLKAATMNFVVLDQPLTITGKYFIGYTINYNNSSDTVAVYSSKPRTGNDQNRAFCIVSGLWEPFYWIPEINLKTSLLINSYGCGTTFAQTNPGPTPVGDKQFKVYYPIDPSLNVLYLINSGKEEFGRVTIYDMLGRKISETQRMLTTSPMEIGKEQMGSSVYFVAVETLTKREVLKVKVIRNK
jgi:hypothetical protein